MKSLQRYLSLFCCFLLLFVLFSSTVSAAPVANGQVRMYQEAWTYGNIVTEWRTAANIYSGEAKAYIREKTDGLSSWTNKYTQIIWAQTFLNSDGSPLFLSGYKYTFSASNVYSYFTYYYNKGSSAADYPLGDGENILQVCYVKYTDGSTGYLNGTFTANTYNRTATFKVTFEPIKDVRSICFEVISPGNKAFTFEDPMELTKVEMQYGSANAPLSIDISSSVIDEEQKGLLETIISKIKSLITNIGDGFSGLGTGISNLFGKVTDGFSDMAKRLGNVLQAMKNGFTDTVEKLGDMLETLTNLPANIWSYLKKGLTNLFVPDKMYLEQEYDKWNVLLEDKFGILYQGVSYIKEFFDRIDITSDGDTYIHFPKVTIPLPDNNEFSFGGFNVNVIPSKFYPIAQSCKTIVGIICTFAFLNGLRKRYESIVGG